MLQIRDLGLQDYTAVWQAMRQFTDQRTTATADEIWFVEHLPVFTLGQAGKETHILNAGQIPVVRTDRGGQVTYHGPGQLVAYFLLDLRRLNIGIRELVCLLEQSVIAVLADYQIRAESKRDAPGVYINGAKICSIGLRVRRGCAYHGIAFNVKMDLAPFNQINPCGFTGMRMTQLAEFCHDVSLKRVADQLSAYMVKKLSYTRLEQPLGVQHA